MAAQTANRLFVGNLKKEITKEEIKSEFEKLGPITSVWLSLRSPHFAFVEFENVEDAAKARSELNGKDLKGSCIRVEISREQMHPKKNKNPAFSKNPLSPLSSEGNDNLKAPDRKPMSPLPCTANGKVKNTPNKNTFFRTRNFYNSNRFKNRNTGELNCSHSSENVPNVTTTDVK